MWDYFLFSPLLLQDLLKPDFDWGSIFEPYPYSKIHSRFLKIYLSASEQDELGDWVGWVKSRFRSLIVKVSGSYWKFIVYTIHIYIVDMITFLICIHAQKLGVVIQGMINLCPREHQWYSWSQIKGTWPIKKDKRDITSVPICIFS